jgi:hypothetical protein
VAKLPRERLRYWYRRQYNLPPTDERFLATTDLQIELEWESWKLANPHLVKKEEAYHDPNYEAAESAVETEAEDEAPVQSAPTDADVEAAQERLAALQKQMRAQIERGTSAPLEWEDVPPDDGGDEP